VTAVGALGANDHGAVAGDDRDAREAGEPIAGLGHRGHAARRGDEDAVTAARAAGAKGDRAGAVHAGAERADGGQPVAGLGQRLQRAAARRQQRAAAVSAPRVEADVAAGADVGVAHHVGAGQLRDLLAVPGEDAAAAAGQRRLERHRAAIVDRCHVRVEVDETVVRTRDCGEREAIGVQTRRHRADHYKLDLSWL